MARLVWFAQAVLILAGVTLGSAPASAQPARNGDIYDGTAHQPTQGAVVRREDKAGVEPPPAVRQENRQTVDEISKQLLHDEAVDPPKDPQQVIRR